MTVSELKIAASAAPVHGPAVDLSQVSVGLVHDWLTTYVGGERVLEQMITLFPQSNLYTTIDTLPADQRAFLQGKQPITTFAQRLPGLRKHYRKWLPLLMFAVEQLDLSDRELVLSSSASVGRGVLTGPDQLHIAYVHSPMRYAWDLQHQYLREAGLEHGMKSLLARWLLHRARFWDMRTANGIDHFIANSHFIARRIWKVYRRPSTVIYPPVDVEQFAFREQKEDFYLVASRMVPYKKIPLLVEAFARMPHRKLVVVGEGTEMPKAKQLATSNIEILGYQPSPALRDLMQRAKAFVFAAEEDFGIAPVEAQACGTPVIAYGRGGALETIKGVDSAHPTGVFFETQTVASIIDAVERFEHAARPFDPKQCRTNALRFSTARFRESYGAFVAEKWRLHRTGGHSREELPGTRGA